MVIVETPILYKLINEIMKRRWINKELQKALVIKPDLGVLLKTVAV